MERFIGYIRTSTIDQVAGLEAQKTAITNYIKSVGGELVEFYQEQMTGTSKRKRVEVYKAVAAAIECNGTLVVSKIDRIGRDLGFWQEVKRSGVKFLSLDNPGGSDLIANIMMSIAESEAKWIKQRQMDSYKELKKKGRTFGKVENLTAEARERAIQNSSNTRKEMARLQNKKVIGYICDLKELANKSFGDIARRLNELGYQSSRGKKFSYTTVKQLYLTHYIFNEQTN